MADSLKLALLSAVACAVAWSGLVGDFGGEPANTAAFLLYYTWPGISLIIPLLVSFFAVREVRAGRRWQAAVGILVSLAVLVVSWTQFYGWE